MTSTRWSTIPTQSQFGQTEFLSGQSNHSAGCLLVDEFVFDPSSGTFASFQEPPSLSSLLNKSNEACSFIR